MDRIASYIEQVFAKFQDVPEIRAQKEEMADHLRDRIHDAMNRGMGEKEAFESVTGTMSESMSDLEQTLGEHLRKEYCGGNLAKPIPVKPESKEIYINFYRFHRVFFIFIGQLLLTIPLIVTMSNRIPLNPSIDAQMGLLCFAIVGLSLAMIFSVCAYVLHPLRIKRVSTDVPWLLLKFLGYLMLFLGLFFLPLLYGRVSFDPYNTDAWITMCGNLFAIFVITTILYFMTAWLGWWNIEQYTKAPNPRQDSPMVKVGLIGLAVAYPVVVFCLLFSIGDSQSEMMTLKSSVDANRQQQAGEISRLQNDINRLHGDINRLLGFSPINRPIHAVAGPDIRDQQTGLPPSSPPGMMGAMGMSGSMGGFGMNGSVEMSPMGGPMMSGPPIPQPPGQFIRDNDPFIRMSFPGFRESIVVMKANPELKTTPSGMFSMSANNGSGMGSGGMSSSSSGMGGMLPGQKFRVFDIPHELSWGDSFPVEKLDTLKICMDDGHPTKIIDFKARKLGKITAAFSHDEASKTITARLGIANLETRNRELLLTMEYGDGLSHEKYPSGTTFYLDVFAAQEYREFEMPPLAIIKPVVEFAEQKTITFTLRNREGLVLDQYVLEEPKYPVMPTYQPAMIDEKVPDHD